MTRPTLDHIGIAVESIDSPDRHPLGMQGKHEIGQASMARLIRVSGLASTARRKRTLSKPRATRMSTITSRDSRKGTTPSSESEE